MSEIKAGDLVVQVHPHCSIGGRYLGVPFVVGEARLSTPTWVCTRCNGVGSQAMIVVARELRNSKGGPFAIPMAWVRKIEPLSDPEHAESGRELKV